LSKPAAIPVSSEPTIVYNLSNCTVHHVGTSYISSADDEKRQKIA
jgi:hypothetical protein